jgi:hypothetical protein
MTYSRPRGTCEDAAMATLPWTAPKQAHTWG